MRKVGLVILLGSLTTAIACVTSKTAPTANQAREALIKSPVVKASVASPQKDKEGLVVYQNDHYEIWLHTVATKSKKLAKSFDAETGIRNLSWAPDGKTLAFETYNLAGHSPLTTFRVWVVRSDDASIKEIRLPPPNEAMSTFIGKWESSNNLSIRSTIPSSDKDVFFVYDLLTDSLTRTNLQ
jgi:hypothetical protein